MGLPVEVNPLFLENQYAIQRSLRFRASASAYLSRTPASATNRKTWTWSGWVKLGIISATNQQILGSTAGTTDATHTWIGWTNGNIFWQGWTGQYASASPAVYRDPSSWYHLVLQLDTTQSTASDRMKTYINGVRQTMTAGAVGFPSLNADLAINLNQAQDIGGRTGGTLNFDGYMAEVNFIDGQALTPSSFGQYNEFGVWSPRKYGGSYGTNGFYLQFTDIALTSGSNAGLGKDFSGNTNYWTTNNISVTAGATYDAMTDVPTPSTIQNVAAGNYAVWSPFGADTYTISGSALSVTSGNLDATANQSLQWSSTRSWWVIPSSGKWYFEITLGGSGAGTGSLPIQYGVMRASSPIGTPNPLGGVSYAYMYASYDGKFYNNNTTSITGSTYASGDTIGIALDIDNGAIYFSKNGTWQNSGVPTSGSSKTGAIFTTGIAGVSFTPCVSIAAPSSPSSLNGGQRPFSYTPPSGFLPLNTNNLPSPTIPNGAKVMAATLYTGNGVNSSSTQNINNGTNTTLGTTFQPDLVWVKSRNTADYHNLVDSVRGISTSSPNLFSNATSADTVFANAGITAVSGTGFTLLSFGSYTNTNGNPYVSWQWNAGSGSSTVPSGGTITPTGASINVSAGFSIITFTASNISSPQTVGHGLGVAPSMIIVKPRSYAGGWYVYHSSLGNTKFIELQSTAAATTSASPWNNTSPTPSVFTLGASYFPDASNNTYVAYCWAAISGYSSMGSFTGNGSADGPMIFTNMRPRYLFIKRTDSAGTNWWQVDSSCNPYNVTSGGLSLNTADAESSGNTWCDFLSNGFKIRTSSVGVNASGGTYIYAAFAENPFRMALAR